MTTAQTNVMTTNQALTTNNGTMATGTAELDTPDQFTTGTLTNASITVSGFNHDGTTLSDTTKLTASDAFTVSSAAATGTTALSALDQYGAGTLTSATITISGANHDGTALSDGTPLSVTNSTTIDDLINHINTVLDAGGTAGANGVASLVNGKIVVTDAQGGYSQTDITLTFANSGTATLTTPASFTASTPLAVTSTTTVSDLINHINTVLDAGGTPGANGVATLMNGKIVVTDAVSGYSKSDIRLTFANEAAGTGAASLELPTYFEMTTVGGEEVKNVNITVYDSQGGQHVLSGAFVRTDTSNTWDLVLSSITGDVAALTPANRRIEGIKFNASDGSYAGLDSTIGDTSQFTIAFAHDPSNPQTVNISMGQVGQLDGLTQFAGNSTAVAREQDGYGAGRLSTVSVNKDGILIGAFSNGVKKNICALQIALFQNTSGLENVGGNYFIPSANSGGAVATQALTGGAGSVHGGSLEKSNADVATEFVNLINAQNGFQANSRTIRVATDILAELATLIR
jgi:flagellar hook-basal body protein